ncbi:glycosyltransferase [Fredinandcohnia sp. 179-A 10B2 NHS]|uniref:glycosyltransferase n=1 Tax=Fredinandcohnia sp. 179-A 10B2 NHS TaxID=3235176 RepID=UPI0039A19AED
MKKKLLFMVKNMNLGGTEKALLNMLSEIPNGTYDITVLMLEKYGVFLNDIPSGIKVEYLNGFANIKDKINNPPLITAKNLLLKGKVTSAIYITVLHLISKVTKNRIQFYNYIFKNFPTLKNEYDIAVAYAGPMDIISYFIAYKINSKKKIQWIHFDLEKINFNKEFAEKIYPNFNKVYVVSEEAKKQLENVLPQLREKIEVFFNILSSNLMASEASKGEGFNDQFKGTRILTVGRLTAQKGQDLIPGILSRLISEGYDVKWYCVGEGNSRFEIEKLINEYNLENHLLLLGNIKNPYPYFKECDLYVQPSRFEGYCITLAEARAFNKPIVITDFVGSEQISDKKTGLIVKCDQEQLYRAIKNLLDDTDFRIQLTNNLKEETVDTVSELDKLYKIVGN